MNLHLQSERSIRIAPEAYKRFQEIATQNNYPARQFTRFMNDLAITDMYSDPSKIHLRITDSIGKRYFIGLSPDSRQALNDVALSSGLPQDPSVVLNNIYSGYITPIIYPNLFQAWIDSGIPLPEFPTSQPKELDDTDTYHTTKETVFLSLTPAARLRFTSASDIITLAYGNYTFTDTRPTNVKAEHEAQSLLHIPQRWDVPGEKSPSYFRLEADTTSILSTIARDQFNITAKRQQTPNALAASLLNAIAEGWITIES